MTEQVNKSVEDCLNEISKLKKENHELLSDNQRSRGTAEYFEKSLERQVKRNKKDFLHGILEILGWSVGIVLIVTGCSAKDLQIFI